MTTDTSTPRTKRLSVCLGPGASSAGLINAARRGEMAVYVISEKSGEQRETTYTIRPQKIDLSDYGAGLLFFILASLLCFLMFPHFHLSNLIMVYLLGVMITAASCGRGPAILGFFLSVLGFDFFFVPPRFSFTNVIAGDSFSVLHQDIIKEIQIAQAAFITGQMAGLGTGASPTSENLYE
jgi:K+-sensing histidine kinase KdpD